MMALRLRPLIALIVVALLASTHAVASDEADEPPANPATATELPQVNVISTTPLEGLGLPLNQIPASVQTADSAEMERQQTLDLANYLNSNFAGITASESAANPFQLVNSMVSRQVRLMHGTRIGGPDRVKVQGRLVGLLRRY